MKTNDTGRDSDQFTLRLPDGMREILKARAAGNRRAMNAEVLALLELGMNATATPTAENCARLAAALHQARVLLSQSTYMPGIEAAIRESDSALALVGAL